jgi:glutamyl-tRNA synthetase
MKTRFSPSPTGQMHLGNVRTALFSFLLAHHAKGTFLLRIEDTDKTRSKPEFVQLLQDDLIWLGLNWDEGPFFQSKRQEIYGEYYSYLEDHNDVYPCFCTDEQLALSRKIQISSSLPPRYAGTCRHLTPEQIETKKTEGLKPTLRFKVPEGKEVHFHDVVKGLQRFRTDDIGDFIIRRNDGSASFFFCNAIDDALMGVTYSIRGEDHLTNTPRQILILSALKLPIPHYGHLSLILAEDGSPLSKREGSLSLETLRAEGYLPLALNNYLGRLGHYYENNDFLSMEQLIKDFSVDRIGKTPAHFDPVQLMHWQKLAVMNLSDENFWLWLFPSTKKIIPEDKQKLFIELMRPNVLFPKDAEKWANIFFGSFILEEDAKMILQSAGKDFLFQLRDAIEKEGEDYTKVIQVLSQSGLKGKALFQPLRIALTSQISGPELAGIFKLLGKSRLLEKIKSI